MDASRKCNKTKSENARRCFAPTAERWMNADAQAIASVCKNEIVTETVAASASRSLSSFLPLSLCIYIKYTVRDTVKKWANGRKQ